MKKLLLASAGILALGIASASAADMRRAAPAPMKAPAYVAPVFTWTGPYVGINGGYGWGSSEFTAPLGGGSIDTDGWLIGGTLGYNWQTGPFVIGLEGDIAWSGIKGSTACGGTSCEVRNNWLGTARGRLGYAMGSFMPYVTGGLAVGNVKTTVAGIGDTSDTNVGWTVGAGLEAQISGPWSAKLEYLYVDLGESDTVLGGQADFNTNIVRAGLNYRF